jgi:hypothetical protein
MVGPDPEHAGIVGRGTAERARRVREHMQPRRVNAVRVRAGGNERATIFLDDGPRKRIFVPEDRFD